MPKIKLGTKRHLIIKKSDFCLDKEKKGVILFKVFACVQKDTGREGRKKI